MMKTEVSNKQSGTERVVSQFTDLMIQTIEGLQQGWRKTWITTEASGRPLSVTGRGYSYMNEFFLYMHCEQMNFRYPLYVTVNKANAMGAHVNKGEKGAPVLFWKLDIKDDKGIRIDSADYDKMSRDQQGKCTVFPVLKYYTVFNIDQTNLAEVQPDKIRKIIDENFSVPELRGSDGMYANSALDSLIDNQSWVCPISCKQQNNAFYSRKDDSITIPEKQQFNLGGTEDEVFLAGQEFYSTMLHEMTHSTGSPDRLNRKKGEAFGDDSYAREELVAELTAALMGHQLGFNTRIQENNAAYLNCWLKSLKQDPKFLVSLLADVNKAARMIEQHINTEAA